MFYAPIYNLLIFLTEILGHTLGWGILALTVFIRMLLIWPQHKMMVSQKKLQTIQPKIKQIQKEFKGNQQMLGMKMMELYKKEQVNPMGSCGFLLIQMPILIVLYNVILNVMDPTNYFHLYQILVDYNLHDIQSNFFGMDLLASGGLVGIILGLVVGLIQYVQVKLSLADKKTPASDVVLEKKKDENDYSQLMPDPEMMNKFMLYGMPVMVAVFTYTLVA
jgi:YidC/Oxa1 family membrane protein insertase